MHDQELTLDQMLDDPIVRLLMARDGVAEADLRGLAARIRPRRGPVTKDAAQVSPEPRSFRPDIEA
ncbi:hypothetical protein [Brevundimonas sp.]|uniref:hypothetical protein n=1 Tax=Brevundimonas sp. TaxID=1871086 RepID=UPI00116C1490|nr:hypothetical protein [Brevundimonas sp.]MDZ4320051.1 hypothetical protein [Phenylobacterium sp.]TPW01520.1 MAG: hypothetical protein FD125_2529 [bacterium]MDO9587420.1 hypothetical protein [Brevundimonas sp.]MDZ4062257.1 hypothetical protein [Brevundimonas sp.]HWQ87657.1 hypothetical protein [Brevundimonas sp.]